MPNWIRIETADVYSALQAPELDSLRTAALAVTQGDPVLDAIAVVVPRVRGFIASHPGNKIDQDATLIPPELFQDAVWLVIQALKIRLGDAVPFSDSQKTILTRAESDLHQVALGDLRVSIPQNPETTPSIQSGGGAEIASTRTRLFGDLIGPTTSPTLNTLNGAGITDGVSTNGRYVDPAWLVSFPWQWLSNKPTTAAAAGISDAVVTGGSYSDPGWLTLSIAKITGLAAALAACLTTATAASTYLSQANAASTYLSQANAASTYLTIANAASTYLSQANAASTYLTIANAAFTYATIASPSHTGGMTIAYGTAATALSPLTITQTWNGSGIVFPGLVYNATDTLSAAGSFLLQLQLNSSTVFSVSKSGSVTMTGGPTLTGSNPAFVVSGTLLFNGDFSLGAKSGGLFIVNSSGAYTWSATTAYNTTPDTYLYRYAAGVIALRNGANAQGFRLYNTYNGTNDEFLTIDFTTFANTALIGPQKTGTGTQRRLIFDGADYQWLIAGASTQGVQLGAANFFPLADIGVNLGTTSNRWNNLCAKTILASGAVDTITVKNSSTSGWSDIVFADSSGTSKGAIGFGNSTASLFASLCFVQAFNVDFVIYGGASGTTENFRFNSGGGVTLPKTITAAGTTGAQTINKPAGSVNFAAAATSLVVTNSLVTVNSVVKCQLATNDTTAVLGAVVKAAGSFTIFMKTAPTAETRVDFVVATL